MIYSGNDHTATYTHSAGSVTWDPAGGVINGAVDFSNVTGQHRIEAGNFDVHGTGITMMAWINQDAQTNDAAPFETRHSKVRGLIMQPTRGDICLV